MKEAHLKKVANCISNYVMSWEKENYGDIKKMNSFPRFRGKEG